ncbi:ExeA family protein [Pseudomonas aeruginosa]|uniref:ExeA family protein n=1 Tax=Pseudomonas aeruginosa TaxID=287 RepID=UPI000E694BAC|nr:AAA family ATPase [Pseudomonas aeruginosa]QLF40584.1 AAA family ATPase [Pseudomonas aeruginosa]RIZ02314.1 transposase [Pseudomonas aeruginosa]
MPMKLKRVLADLGIAQSELAASLEKPDGQSLSQAAIAQLVNHGQWPKSLDRSGLEHQIKETLFARGANDDHIRDVFVMETDAAQVLEGRAAPVLNNADSRESDAMLLRKNTLTDGAKQHFQLRRDPFTNEIHSEDDVFVSDDIRYVRQAMRQTAKHGGMLAVIGESGAGKSTLREGLHDWIETSREPITIIEPYVLGSEDSDRKGKAMKSMDLLSAIIRRVGNGERARGSLEERSDRAHDLLLEQVGKNHVLLIEEAHCLTRSTIKHLKRFLEIKRGHRQLLSIILIGQTELDTKLSENDPEVREVVQRCEKVFLRPLDSNLESYVQHKFERIGANYLDLFAPSAFDEIRARLRRNSTQGRGANRSAQMQSLCYPLAVNNLISGAMNEAVKISEAKVNGELIAAAVRAGV